MGDEYPRCTSCEDFGTTRCENCLWSVEYRLICRYGSWDRAVEEIIERYERVLVGHTGFSV